MHDQGERGGHLLRRRAQVEDAAAELEPVARPLVERVVATHGVGVCLAQPAKAGVLALADLLVGRRAEDQVAGRREPLPRKGSDGDSARRHLALHVQRAPAPDAAVLDLARPRIDRPLRRIREHRVGVREQEERRPGSSSRNPRDEVRAVRGARVELARDAVLLEIPAQKLGRDRLVPRRIHRVEADQVPEQRDDFVANGGWHRGSILSPMGDLFSDAAMERAAANAPLAARVRPRALDELVGQQHVLGPGSALRAAIEEDRVGSMVLYGPPGSGKTTLARIVASSTGAAFEQLSAVSASVSEVRGVIAGARERLGAHGQRTILFLDEIHRFNKAQQDALLPSVEEGILTLIGATTENPYFEVNAALLSRCAVYELEPLSQDDLSTIIRRGGELIGAEPTTEVVELIAARAGGDGRTALNILELAAQTAAAAEQPLAPAHVEDAARKRPLRYDRAGDQHYDFASAFIKSMRGSDPDAAVYYLAAMLEAGEDARFIARRMVILASEDVGLADPNALVVAVAAAGAVEHVGLPEAQLNLAEAAIYLALAPKSNAVLAALTAARKDVREHGTARPPKSLRSTGHPGQRTLGHGEGYVYPHDDPAGFEVDYLPEELKGRRYYDPDAKS